MKFIVRIWRWSWWCIWSGDSLKHASNKTSVDLNWRLWSENVHEQTWNYFIRWPWKVTALQLKKTHAKRQNTSKLRKRFHQFDNTCAAFRKRAAKTTTQRKCFQGTLKSDAHVWTRLLLTRVLSYTTIQVFSVLR